jgi:hypothetical protein
MSGGVRQWGRLCSLVVAPASGNDGLDLSELRVSFRMESRTFFVEPDTLQVRVYNLAPDTIQKLMALPIVPVGNVITGQAITTSSQPAGSATGLGNFNNPPITQTPPGLVSLKAGYEGNFGTIFQGQLVQIRQGRETPTDSYIDIFAADGDSSHRWGVMNVTLAAGWTAQDVAKQAVQACSGFGLTGGAFPTVTDPAQRPAPRGKVCFGMMRDILDDVARTHRVDTWINRNRLEFVRQSAYKPGEAIVLTGATGMVTYPHQTNFGVSVRCLLNPSISRG